MLYKVIVPLYHNGKLYNAGENIELQSSDDPETLLSHRVIEKAQERKKTSEKNEN
ncbi:MAG: hypothetical protein HPY78_03455 [Brevinematales bacterium]|nr:hypothetical protein [Brevinematales bacterium]